MPELVENVSILRFGSSVLDAVQLVEVHFTQPCADHSELRLVGCAHVVQLVAQVPLERVLLIERDELESDFLEAALGLGVHRCCQLPLLLAEEVVSLRRQDLLSLREVLAVLERRVVLPLREVAAPHVLVLICDHDLVDHEVRVHPQLSSDGILHHSTHVSVDVSRREHVLPRYFLRQLVDDLQTVREEEKPVELRGQQTQRAAMDGVGVRDELVVVDD
mmetsp:Transcript_55841/g.131482  ORF Transcript_55841/g.131482 Transcript_55841/m.131482 type:complete len:219 (+) Transcript_55841:2174-2830(+)